MHKSRRERLLSLRNRETLKRHATQDTPSSEPAIKKQAARKRRIHDVQDSGKELCEMGTLVWCIFSKHHWPAVVVDAASVGVSPAKPGKVWVLWFGSKNLVSEVRVGKLEAFNGSSFLKYYPECKQNEKRHSAALQAVKECMRRCDISTAEEDDPAKWALQGFQYHGIPQQDLYKPCPGVCKFPEWMIVCFEKLQKINQKDSDDSSEFTSDDEVDDDNDDDDEDSSDEETETTEPDRRSDRQKCRELSWAEVVSGHADIKDVCLSCGMKNATFQHPLFIGGVCKNCKPLVVESFVTLTEDGDYVYCAICGRGGEQYMCDDPQCLRLYCRRCVLVFGSTAELDLIKGCRKWRCYLCCSKTLSKTDDDDCFKEIKPSPKTEFGLKIREIDEEDILMFCRPTPKQICQQPIKDDTTCMKKRPVRVLSLFDGMGTGRFVLNALRVAVDVYYSCEVDEDAILLTKIRHGDEITQLGDVTKLTSSKLKTLCPIDLLIGGSPCNELSAVNHARLGLGAGSGLLFFEYYRIFRELQLLNPPNHTFFWLFENVASMSSETKSTISRFLDSSASMWDAQHFSAQQRRRLFWGNIPGLFHRYELASDEREVLKDVLMPSRDAKCDTIKCVTTKPNSLVRGKAEKIFPVKMGPADDVLWIPEIERIFGFPEHYTDVGDLGRTRRQRLLGRSWSVPVVRTILQPLKFFFSEASK